MPEVVNQVIKIPSDYTSIQSAIDVASDGDTVSVSAGTYKENIDFKGKYIVVMGENKETTIIDGNQNGSVVTFGNEETSNAQLIGFTIQNGTGGGPYGKDGGGILCYSNSNPTLNNLRILNNQSQRGGGIACLDAEPIIKNSFISNNTPS